MVDVKPVSTPLASHFVLSTKQSPSSEVALEEMKKILYVSTVGCLMYVMVCTRPDLAQAMNVVSKLCQIRVESIGKLSSRFSDI